jgi:hypothetical protein
VKKLIDNSGEIHTYVELKPLTNPQHQGWYQLRVSTVYDAARNPNEEQVKLDMCLSPDAYSKLKGLFNDL